MDYVLEGGVYNQQYQDVVCYYDMEGEVQWCDVWNGIFGCFGDLFFCGVSDVWGIVF